MDSTTNSRESADSTRTTNMTSSTLEDQRMNSPSWRKDLLIGLGGPMSRSRAKKMKEALHGLVRSIQQTTKTQVEEKLNFITLLRVIED